MISIRQIHRLIEHQSDHQLASRVLANGRCHCPHLRELLLARERVRLVALGLALQRACELVYHPGESRLVPGVADRLLAAQSESSFFGERDDLAASAVALAGLLKWRALCEESGADVDARLDVAIERGVDAIAEALNQYAPNRASDESATLVIAAVLWQLGHVEAFRQRCCVPRLLQSIEPRYARAVDAVIWQYAAAQAA